MDKRMNDNLMEDYEQEKSFGELDLVDDYMFDVVTEDLESCKLILKLGDETSKIILNTKGTNDAEEDPTLISFLHYVENSSEEVLEESSDPRLKRLHEIIESIRSNAEMEAQYMKGITREREKIADAKAAGRKEDIVMILLELGEIPDEIWNRVKTEEDIEVLKKWLLIAAKASSIEEFREEQDWINPSVVYYS